MEIDLSIIIPVRDMEAEVAATVRVAAAVRGHVRAQRDEALDIEILVLDERSGDNTLSVLSVLHAQIDNLRTVQDLDIGSSIQRGARVARGRIWLLVDHPVDPRLCGWAVSQVLSGHRAALIPGELLAVNRHIGNEVLRNLPGGLVSAQDAVVRYLRARDDRPAFSPAPNRTARHRARLLVRRSLRRLGFVRFDRP